MDVEKWLGSISLYEAAQIWAQFNSFCDPNGAVLWSGVGFVPAQRWATAHHRKTLTHAMGPLMDKSHPRCRCHFKSSRQFKDYVHAASILFTLHISQGNQVVVLTPHPPERLNPKGASYYQKIEEPWLTSCCDADNFQILFAHPRVAAASDFLYQYWPVDKVNDWTARYPEAGEKPRWQANYYEQEEISSYQPMDLRRERDNVMQKLHLYKTGASIYWTATSPANLIAALPSARKGRATNEGHQMIADEPKTKTCPQTSNKKKKTKSIVSRSPATTNTSTKKTANVSPEPKKEIKMTSKKKKKKRKPPNAATEKDKVPISPSRSSKAVPLRVSKSSTVNAKTGPNKTLGKASTTNKKSKVQKQQAGVCKTTKKKKSAKSQGSNTKTAQEIMAVNQTAKSKKGQSDKAS